MKSNRTRAVVSLLLSSALVGQAVAAPAPGVAAPAPAAASATKSVDAKTIGDARKAVDKGITFLRSKQAENGSYGNHVGLTSMALVAMAESHRAYRVEDGPFVRLAADWLVAQQRADGAITGDATPAYNTSLAIMALQALDPVKFKAQIEAGQRFLVKDQTDEDKKYLPTDKYYGGIGYGGDERPDLSNLQLAVEALRKTGYDPASDVWKKAETFLSRCQNRSESNDQPWSGNDGGFVFEPGDSKAGGTKSYAGMTFAGLKSLIFAQVKKDDPRVKAAWSWLQQNYDFTQHPGMGTTTYYFYLNTAAVALEAFGEAYVPDDKGRKRSWAQDLGQRLVSIQRADGSWLNENGKYWEDNPVLVTSRALIALNSALRSAGANEKN